MEKDNKQEDFVFSEAAISASFFAFENREFVEGHFNKLTVEMVKCANDEKFITNLRELKKETKNNTWHNIPTRGFLLCQ
jgi:hypothetical protein